MYVNSAGREQHGENIEVSRFKGSAYSGQKVVVYTLRLLGLQEEDAGFYSCIFKTKDMIPVGYYIKPGGMDSALLLYFGLLPWFFSCLNFAFWLANDHFRLKKVKKTK